MAFFIRFIMVDWSWMVLGSDRMGTWNSGTQNPGLGFTVEKLVEGMLNKAFLHYMPNFCHIWWLFKVERTKEALQNFNKIIKRDKNLAKTEGKPTSTCLKPILRLIPGTQNSDFGYPFRATSPWQISFDENFSAWRKFGELQFLLDQ